MKRVLLIATLLLVAALAFAQTNSSSGQSGSMGQSGSAGQSSMGQSSMGQSSMAQAGSADEQELLKIEQQWADAMKSGDAAALQRIEADNYKFTNPEGVTTTKQDDLSGIKSGKTKYESVELSDLKPQVSGDTATVTGKITMKGTENGKDVSGTYDFTDTFQKINGTWQAVSTKTTKAAE